MADDSGGGGGISRRVAGMPVWVWALGIGGVAGLVWLARRRTAAGSTAGSAAAATDPTEATTIVPQYGGLAEAQYANILAAIQSLQGPPSTPPEMSTLPEQVTSPPAGIPPGGRVHPPHRDPWTPVASGETAASRY